MVYFLSITPELIILCGLQFSGKTYIAEKIRQRSGAVIISFDEIYTGLVENFEKNGVSMPDRWDRVKRIAIERMKENLEQGNSVIWDSINPRREYRDELKNLAYQMGLKSTIIFVKTPMTTIKQRLEENKERQLRHSINTEDLERTVREMEEPTESEQAIIITPEEDLNSLLDNLIKLY